MFLSHKAKILAVFIILISFIYLPIYTSANYLQENKRIITASAVRVRSNPQTTALEITKLSVGTIVKEIAKSERKEKIGQQEDFWYQVTLSDGKQGWVFGAFTLAFEPSKQEQIYVNLLNERLKAKTSFSDQVDLVNFLDQAIKEIKTPTILAELELGQLLALRQSIQSIPIDKQDTAQYKPWLKKHDSRIVYNEPAGSWEVKSDMFWNLQKKYSSLPIADKIAWEGAKNTIPGECEGYVPCYIGAIDWTNAKYLSLYPNGEHSQEALKEILEELNTFIEELNKPEPSYTFPNDADSRKDLQDQLGNVRKTLSKVPTAKTANIFKQMDLLAAKFR